MAGQLDSVDSIDKVLARVGLGGVLSSSSEPLSEGGGLKIAVCIVVGVGETADRLRPRADELESQRVYSCFGGASWDALCSAFACIKKPSDLS